MWEELPKPYEIILFTEKSGQAEIVNIVITYLSWDGCVDRKQKGKKEHSLSTWTQKLYYKKYSNIPAL